jgi:quercetin dioxygenase-like cupin family protein
MRTILIVALSILGVTTSAFAKGQAATKSKASDAVIIEAKDIKWSPVEGFAGVQSSTIEGDAAKGAHHSFMKFDAGFAAPLHTHTADHYVTVVAGTVILNVDGIEHRLPVGSYFAFKNKKAHTTTCMAGAECILFTDVRGKWDVTPVKESTISSK